MMAPSLIAILRLGAIVFAGVLLWKLFQSEKAHRQVERERAEHLKTERQYREDRLRERGD
jgi:hypothetical protein